MHSVANLVYEGSDVVAAPFSPSLNCVGLFGGTNVDACFSLELAHAAVAVAEVGLWIFLVHNQAIFFPQAAAENHVGVADIVELNKFHLGDGSNLLDFFD